MTGNIAAADRLAYTPREAATLLGASYKAVLRAIHTGSLGARKMGKTYVIPRSELDRYLAECELKTA